MDEKNLNMASSEAIRADEAVGIVEVEQEAERGQADAQQGEADRDRAAVVERVAAGEQAQDDAAQGREQHADDAGGEEAGELGGYACFSGYTFGVKSAFGFCKTTHDTDGIVCFKI